MSTSPDRKGLNLSARRCEACNPELRDNYFRYSTKESTTATKRKKKVGKKGKSPYQGRKSTTPGRKSTKYSESAYSGFRDTHSPRTKDIAQFSPMRPDDEGELIEVFK